MRAFAPSRQRAHTERERDRCPGEGLGDYACAAELCHACAARNRCRVSGAGTQRSHTRTAASKSLRWTPGGRGGPSRGRAPSAARPAAGARPAGGRRDTARRRAGRCSRARCAPPAASPPAAPAPARARAARPSPSGCARAPTPACARDASWLGPAPRASRLRGSERTLTAAQARQARPACTR